MIERFIDILEIDKFDHSLAKVILDVGSRDGLQSLEFSEVFHDAEIHAFECNPDTFDQVLSNTKNCSKIKANNCAVNDYDGECTFYQIDKEATKTPWADGNPGASSLFISNGSYTHEEYIQKEIKVKSMTIDSYCNSNEINSIDLIWMDLQGAELKAFKGMEKMLPTVRYIYVELTHKEIYKNQPLFDEVNTYLLEHGFERITDIDRNQWFEDVVYRNNKEKEKSEKRVVLSNPWGGLGDNLQYSTLPERFWTNGYQVWISIENKVRNLEIAKLVWGKNPYVSGITSEAPNIGAHVCLNSDNYSDLNLPFISRIELAHNLRPINKYPKIYIEPKSIPNLESKILIDLGSTSVSGGTENLTNYITHVITKYRYRMEDLIQVRHKNINPVHTLQFSNIDCIDCASIFEYCNIIASCRSFITVHSGAQSLAVSMRSMGVIPKIHCLALDWQFNNRDYIYEDIDYYIVRAV